MVLPGEEQDAYDLINILAAAGLVCLAGLMSGLTLALMSMDTVDLEVRLGRFGGQDSLDGAPEPCSEKPSCSLSVEREGYS